MKIVNQRARDEAGTPLCNVTYGEVVQFNKQFNSNYPPNALFIVLNIPDAYFPTKYGLTRDSMGVVHLTTGTLAYVKSDRLVQIMNAQVEVDGPKAKICS